MTRKLIRNLVAFILKKEGYKVTAAEDGLDGLEKLYAMGAVDMIISDINMPRMDGFTFIKTVREQETYRDPVDSCTLYRGSGRRHQKRHKPWGQSLYGENPRSRSK